MTVKSIFSILISSVLVLTACSSVSQEDCDKVLDHILALYQNGENSGEYFESVQDFYQTNCQ